MDEMSSTEFRRRYATLTSPTIVTVNGHAIGHWVPRGWVFDTDHQERTVYAHDTDGPDPRHIPAPWEPPSFNSRPFTPVPKVKR